MVPGFRGEHRCDDSGATVQVETLKRWEGPKVHHFIIFFTIISFEATFMDSSEGWKWQWATMLPLLALFCDFKIVR